MEYVPITSLSPHTALPRDRSLHARVTLVWPFSSSTRQCALLVAERDFRLRHVRGQVRIHFFGPAAEAVARARVSIGDEVQIQLDGAAWRDDSSRIDTPGKSVEGELAFRGKLYMRVVKDDRTEVIDIDGGGEDVVQDGPNSDDATPRLRSIDDRRTYLLESHAHDMVYASPAFSKRLRLSRDLTLDDALTGLFDGEDLTPTRKRPRRSFGLVREWRYQDRSSSPSQVEESDRDDQSFEQVLPRRASAQSVAIMESHSPDTAAFPAIDGYAAESGVTQTLAKESYQENALYGNVLGPPDSVVTSKEADLQTEVLGLSSPPLSADELSQNDSAKALSPAQPEIVQVDEFLLANHQPAQSPRLEDLVITGAPEFDASDLVEESRATPADFSSNVVPAPSSGSSPVVPELSIDASMYPLLGPGDLTPELMDVDVQIQASHTTLSHDDFLQERESLPGTGVNPVTEGSHVTVAHSDHQQQPRERDDSALNRHSDRDTSEILDAAREEGNLGTVLGTPVHSPSDSPVRTLGSGDILATPKHSSYVEGVTPELVREKVMTDTLSSLFGFGGSAEFESSIAPRIPAVSKEEIFSFEEFYEHEPQVALSPRVTDHPVENPDAMLHVRETLDPEVVDAQTLLAMGDATGGTSATAPLTDIAVDAKKVVQDAVEIGIDEVGDVRMEQDLSTDVASAELFQQTGFGPENNEQIDPVASGYNALFDTLHDPDGTTRNARIEDNLDVPPSLASNNVDTSDHGAGSMDSGSITRISDFVHDDTFSQSLESTGLPDQETFLNKTSSTPVALDLQPPDGVVAVQNLVESPAKELRDASVSVGDDERSSSAEVPLAVASSFDHENDPVATLESASSDAEVSDHADQNLLEAGTAGPMLGPVNFIRESSQEVVGTDTTAIAGSSPAKETMVESAQDTRIKSSMAVSEVHREEDRVNAEEQHLPMKVSPSPEAAIVAFEDQPSASIEDEPSPYQANPGYSEQVFRLDPTPVVTDKVLEKTESNTARERAPSETSHNLSMTSPTSSQADMLGNILPIASRTRSRVSILEVAMIENAERRSPRKPSDEDLIAEQLINDQHLAEMEAELTNDTHGGNEESMTPFAREIGSHTTSQAQKTNSSHRSSQIQPSTPEAPPVDHATPRQLRRRSQMAPSTPASTRFSGRLSQLPNAISAWFSPRATPAKTPVKSPRVTTASDEPPDSLSFDTLSQPVTTELAYFTPLGQLSRKINSSSINVFGANMVDCFGVIVEDSAKPVRAKSGPKDFYTTFRVTDPSLERATSLLVEVFRPWKARLPQAEVGDVVLLRAFTLKSRNHEPYLLSTDTSAYCVWRYSKLEKAGSTHVTSIDTSEQVTVQTKGPPVEYGQEESQRSELMRKWWEYTHAANAA